MTSQETAYQVNFRYWIGGKLRQLQGGYPTLGLAKARVAHTAQVCRDKGYDWLGEILPRLASPIVTGSTAGMAHHREIF